MKKLIFAVFSVLLIVILGGYFGYLNPLMLDRSSESDSEDQTPQVLTSQTLIQTKAVPSDSFENLMVVAGTDLNGVEIQILVESSLADSVNITEGLVVGLPETYSPITNGFIEITFDPETQGKQIVRVRSQSTFEVIVVRDSDGLGYTPFLWKDDGFDEFYEAPTNGSITFALMDVPEF
jgi:hypothetical protein